MHLIEEPGGGVGRAAEPVGDLAVREVLIYRARMGGAVRTDELEQGAGVGLARRGPGRARRSRMHQIVMITQHVAVVDEVVLFER